jgi:hypothetical protein
MLVHFVTDEQTKIPAIRAMLEPQHVVEPRLLGVGDKKIISNGVLMVDTDLRRAAGVKQIKLLFCRTCVAFLKSCSSFRTTATTWLHRRLHSVRPPWFSSKRNCLEIGADRSRSESGTGRQRLARDGE